MYSREISDSVKSNLTLAPSGWVYINTFVLYDKQTESLWYPFPQEHVLRCVSGHYADITLPELPSETTSWNNWLQKHPGSKLLSQESY